MMMIQHGTLHFSSWHTEKPTLTDGMYVSEASRRANHVLVLLFADLGKVEASKSERGTRNKIY